MVTFTLTLTEVYKDGKEIEYTVGEKTVSNYVTTIEGNMTEGYVINNKLDNIPYTGDNSDLLFWYGISILCLDGIVICSRLRKKEEEQ